MLEEILYDKIDTISASNQPFFDASIDFDKKKEEHAKAVEKWKSFSDADRRRYKHMKGFFKVEKITDIKDPALQPAKNISLIRNEVKLRLNTQDRLQLLPIDTLDFEDSLFELAESIENTNELQEIYRVRKLATGTNKNSGISTEEAKIIKNCLIQGRELYLSGLRGSLMVKPLNFFYALTAYSYGMILLNNPLRYRKDMLPGSHGMSYLPNEIRASFGGDSPRGTFSDLVTAFPTNLIKTSEIEFAIDHTESLFKFYESRFTVSIGTLLSLIPEMDYYYKLTTGRKSRCYPLQIISANDPRVLKWEFHIGDGENKAPRSGIESSFAGFEISERHGKIIVTVPASKASSLSAMIYTDVRGRLWYIDNPFYPVMLPEVCVHFLLTSMYSNIMRYRPEEWGSVLTNETSSKTSLLTRHYFSTFQRKFLLIVLKNVSRYIPYAE